MGKNKTKVNRGRLATIEYFNGPTAGKEITVFVSSDSSIQVCEDDVVTTTGSERAFASAQEGKLDCYMKLCANWSSGRCVNESRCYFAHVLGYATGTAAVLPALPAAPMAPYMISPAAYHSTSFSPGMYAAANVASTREDDAMHAQSIMSSISNILDDF